MRHEVVDHVSSRMHVPTSLINRLREGKAGTLERLRADQASLAVYMTEEVLDVAARGNVVLRGWGATCLLRTVPHVVCVRVTRPFEQRVAWLQRAASATTTSPSSREEIRRSDRAHAARMHAQFGVTWGDPLLYDLVLNTGRVSVESCAQQIAALAQRPEFAETEASRAMLQNLALEARVRSALRADEATQRSRRHDRERRRPRRSARHGARRRRAAGGRARRRAVAGRGRRRQPVEGDGEVAPVPAAVSRPRAALRSCRAA